MDVGKNIQRLREQRGISQKELAEKSGLSQSMLSQIEKGTKNPSLQAGKYIAETLGCSIDRLVE